MSKPIAAGEIAPDFTLPSTPDQRLSLRDLRGAPGCLVFYPADWSPVCGDQLAIYNEILDELQHHAPSSLGISVDGAWCHAAFARSPQAPVPAARRLRAEGRGGPEVRRLPRRGRRQRARALRARRAGQGGWSYVSPIGINPGADGILEPSSGWRSTEMSKLTRPIDSSDHLLGKLDAPVSLVEYIDYECPHCARAHHVTVEVLHRVGDAVCFAVRHFPLSQIHPHALLAAQVAEAAAAQRYASGRCTRSSSRTSRRSPWTTSWTTRRDALRLDVPRVAQELEASVHLPKVQSDFRSGLRSGVNGTPTFFLDGERLDQAWDADTLTTQIRIAARRGELRR